MGIECYGLLFVTQCGAMGNETLDNVYAFIHNYITQNHVSPSIREIAAGCYINVATVIRYLDKLEAQGKISRDLRKARSIRLNIPQIIP